MVPGDAYDLRAMVELSLEQPSPSAIRYPKASAVTIEGDRQPVDVGKAERLRDGRDGTIICCGTQLSDCLRVADTLEGEGLDVGVINARFVKPLDQETILEALDQHCFCDHRRRGRAGRRIWQRRARSGS